VTDAKPVILTGIEIGDVESLWTADYLIGKLTGRTISIHKGENPILDFRSKNFAYENDYPFERFIAECAQGCVRYLRSVGANFRKDKPNFWADYGEISGDIRRPEIERVHSSVLRISPKNLEIWLHYDTLDNVLIQCHGSKEVLLFDPGDAQNLYLVGDKSYCSGLISNLEQNLLDYPLLGNVTSYSGILSPGEFLFIPALWFHTTKALDFSVSINTFFKSLDEGLYGKDLYANRDPLPVEEAQRMIQKAKTALERLPSRYKNFYLNKLGLD